MDGSNIKSTKICTNDMTIEDCELALLRKAVDEGEKIEAKKKVNLLIIFSVCHLWGDPDPHQLFRIQAFGIKLFPHTLAKDYYTDICYSAFLEQSC